MQIKTPIDPAADLFINSLTPISELARMGDITEKLRFEEAKEYLSACSKNIADFYYNRSNYLAWFCYYRDPVFVDIPFFTGKGLRDFGIVERIELEEKCLNNLLKQKDYKSFFYLVDSRIAFHMFAILFDSIPDNDKYAMMGLIYARCNCSLASFSRDFVERMLRYRPNSLELPGVDQNGYVEIYRGQPPQPITLNNATSWTLDINTAIYFATRHNTAGEVYRGRIHQDKVVAYIKRKNEKEIVAYPEDIKEIERLEFIRFSDLKPVLQKSGVFQRYIQYEAKIKRELFYRPDGIHGISHSRRVLFLLLTLAQQEGLNSRDTRLLCLAVIFHDTGRIDDTFDPGHGLQSYQKVREHIKDELPGVEEQEIVRYVIENHCIDDSNAYKNVENYKISNRIHAQELLKLFKDADGLDRIRINDLNVSHLRYRSAAGLLMVARELLDNPGLLANMPFD